MQQVELEAELLESPAASVCVSSFEGQSGTTEYHLTVRPTEYGPVEEQLERLTGAYQEALDSLGLSRETAVLRRFFCSDIQNAVNALKSCALSNPGASGGPCAVSWIGQAPMPPSRIALSAYHISDPDDTLQRTRIGNTTAIRRGGLTHHWSTRVLSTAADSSYGQTQGLFGEYLAYLASQGMTLEENVLRTWFYVEDVDANYGGLVAARREIFAEHGLTPKTHFIASTGIEGRCADLKARVMLDSYAISGVRPEQVEYLAALDHLSPTHHYGVTFERATSVAYHDRKHIFISGTASIDRHGNILYPGDVSRQLERTLENVEALLMQADATLDDMQTFIVYVRDPSDQAFAWSRMRERFGEAPIEVVVAPVCRPGWLIEVEGTAIVSACNPDLPPF
ncbi:MAG: Rid family hydrolase [Candidatus Hydrogenedentales bacterium]|jgi:enamine deaminase RidA (YjgF/YER057c/UK114 family)